MNSDSEEDDTRFKPKQEESESDGGEAVNKANNRTVDVHALDRFPNEFKGDKIIN